MKAYQTDIAIIAARSRNGVIGRGGAIPWNIPADMKHFKELTCGCAVIMGRRTWQSVGHPLSGRTVIVLTHNPNSVMQILPSKDGKSTGGKVTIGIEASVTVTTALNISQGAVFAACNMDEALSIARDECPASSKQCGAPIVWIAGGESVYSEALPVCGRLCITEVLEDVEGDTYFPAFDKSLYTIEESPVQYGGTCNGKAAKYRFVTYTRR